MAHIVVSSHQALHQRPPREGGSKQTRRRVISKDFMVERSDQSNNKSFSFIPPSSVQIESKYLNQPSQFPPSACKNPLCNPLLKLKISKRSLFPSSNSRPRSLSACWTGWSQFMLTNMMWFTMGPMEVLFICMTPT